VAAGQAVDVAAVAQATLAAVEAHYGATTSDRLPDRRIIASGDARTQAWDCEQVTVTLGGILWGAAPGLGSVPQPTGHVLSSVTVPHVVIVVQIVRRVPVSEDPTSPPDAREITTKGLALMRDAGLLSQALVELCGRAGALRTFGAAQAGDMATLGPAGGYAAVEGTLSVTTGPLQ
jgi:hypothetical protein